MPTNTAEVATGPQLQARASTAIWSHSLFPGHSYNYQHFSCYFMYVRIWRRHTLERSSQERREQHEQGGSNHSVWFSCLSSPCCSLPLPGPLSESFAAEIWNHFGALPLTWSHWQLLLACWLVHEVREYDHPNQHWLGRSGVKFRWNLMKQLTEPSALP